MDEEINLIDAKTRNEKIKSFVLENKRILTFLISAIILILLGFYSYQIYEKKQKEQLSDKYNTALIDFENGENIKVISSLKKIIEYKNSTYSPLALYFIIDNNLIENKNEINELFNIVINETSLEKEIKNLIIYKKALYNADEISENELLDILKPLTNSNSIWKSHALYLIAEYFYANDERQKSREFFEEILIIDNANQSIISETQKRLRRDLSE
tara:strand:+ start:273 stop:917 length:645 start_codon:yes stop_codon:yes gene_type:complete